MFLPCRSPALHALSFGDVYRGAVCMHAGDLAVGQQVQEHLQLPVELWYPGPVLQGVRPVYEASDHLLGDL